MGTICAKIHSLNISIINREEEDNDDDENEEGKKL